MFFVNLVRLLLLVGVLYESGVDAAEHLREQPSDLRGTITSLFETFCNYSQVQHNTEAAMTFFDPESKVLVNGFHPFVGHDEIRTVLEIFTERAAETKISYTAVEPMDKDAEFVYSTFHFDFFNESGEKYVSATELAILKKTADGYKIYIAMFNTHNQSA